MIPTPSPAVLTALRPVMRPSHLDLVLALADPSMATAPPALLDAAGAVVRVTEARLAAQSDPEALRRMIDATTETLSAGGEVPLDLAERAGTLAAETARAQTVTTVLEGASNNVTARFANAAMTHADGVLAGPLRTALTALMARHAALIEAAAGRDFTDPGAFVGAPRDASDAWFAVDTLAADYADLRRVQETVLDAATTREDGYNRVMRSGWHEVAHVRGYDDWPTAARPRFLRAVVSTPVMPTLGELAAAMRGRRGDPVDKPVEEIVVHHHPPVVQDRRVDVTR